VCYLANDEMSTRFWWGEVVGMSCGIRKKMTQWSMRLICGLAQRLLDDLAKNRLAAASKRFLKPIGL